MLFKYMILRIAARERSSSNHRKGLTASAPLSGRIYLITFSFKAFITKIITFFLRLVKSFLKRLPQILCKLIAFLFNYRLKNPLKYVILSM